MLIVLSRYVCDVLIQIFVFRNQSRLLEVCIFLRPDAIVWMNLSCCKLGRMKNHAGKKWANGWTKRIGILMGRTEISG